ncbi:MAG: hypothetical protein ACXV48_02005 [Halobacteriota archaeon]
MPEIAPISGDQLRDAVVEKAAETIFRKYKVIMNTKGRRVAGIDDVYPDLLAYEVLSVKPFLSSDTPALIGIVETEDVITQQRLDKWGQLKDLAVDKIVLLLPFEMRGRADVLRRELGPKFELRFFDHELHIT